MCRGCVLFVVSLILLSVVHGQGTLVHVGTNRLVYTGYANEGQTQAVNTVPDFSSAGYQSGGVAIPFVPAQMILRPGRGDDTELIQRAIDKVSALPVDADGFRGAVLLESGNYTVSAPLVLSSSGVVIRGAGSQEEGGTRITYVARNKSDLFVVSNRRGSPREVKGSRKRIVDTYVPVGASRLTIEDASGFAPGDSVIIQNRMNEHWIEDLSDMGQWGWNASDYALSFRRTVTAVDGDCVTLDAPIVQAIESRYGGGVVYKYSVEGQLEQIGFEGLRLESAYQSEEDEEHGWTAIRMRGLKNGWVRQVTGRYFGYGLVSIERHSQKITVEDCALLDPKSKTTGGRKYSFNIDDADFVLMQRCLTRGGRHDFVSGSQTPGPNVFVDCRADDSFADIGPHHRYSTGQLYDNIMGGEMNVQNRTGSGSGHGWAGAQIMFWNCDARSIICDAPNGAMNWCVGSRGKKSEGKTYWAPEEAFGIWQSHGLPVVPRSLYYAQLAERLGSRALHHVQLPEQAAGTLWDALNEWGGDGLFLDGIVVWLETECPTSGETARIGGRIRNLQMLDRGWTARWHKVSGPGKVSFSDKESLVTAVQFSKPGLYVLQLSADGDAASARLDVLVKSEGLE